VRAFLNINCLYDLFWFIKNEALSKTEQACIIEYQLQTYLIELCQLNSKSYKTFEKLITSILRNLRYDQKFWLEHSDVWNQISSGIHDGTNTEYNHDRYLWEINFRANSDNISTYAKLTNQDALLGKQ
jgi:hypothetical protein